MSSWPNIFSEQINPDGDPRPTVPKLSGGLIGDGAAAPSTELGIA